MTKDAWENQASNIIKSELKKRNLIYNDLVIKLKEVGIEETYESVNTKINRGKFSMSFFLKVCEVLNIKRIGIK